MALLQLQYYNDVNLYALNPNVDSTVILLPHGLR